MGMFDDLLEKKSPGMFDDLVGEPQDYSTPGPNDPGFRGYTINTGKPRQSPIPASTDTAFDIESQMINSQAANAPGLLAGEIQARQTPGFVPNPEQQQFADPGTPYTNNEWLEGRLAGVQGGAARMGAGLLSMAANNPVVSGTINAFGERSPDQNLQNSWREQLNRYADKRQQVQSANTGEGIGGFLTEVGDSTLMMVPSILATAATKNPNIGLAVMGTQVGGQTYQDSLNEGKSPTLAMQDALTATALELGPEKAFGFFDEIAKPIGGMKGILRTMGIESASEATTELGTMLDETIRQGKAAPDLATVLGRTGHAAAAGAIMGGTLGAPGNIASRNNELGDYQDSVKRIMEGARAAQQTARDADMSAAMDRAAANTQATPEATTIQGLGVSNVAFDGIMPDGTPATPEPMIPDQQAVDALDADLEAMLGADEADIAPEVTPQAEPIQPTVQTQQAVESGLTSIPATQLQTDATSYQYKENTDKEGVSERLKGVKQWDPVKAGIVIVHQRNDGNLYVADGHQRTGLARRIAAETGKEPMVNAIVLKESDGYTVEKVRAIAAAKNIAEGSGTAWDAAKVFREGGNDQDMLDSMPKTGALVRDGLRLSKLDPEVMQSAINNEVDPAYAGLIGERFPDDPQIQTIAMQMVLRMDPRTQGQAAIILEDVANSAAKADQTDMFGGLDTRTAQERMKILDRVRAQIERNKSIMSNLLRNRGTIESSAKNVVDAEGTEAVKEQAVMALQIIKGVNTDPETNAYVSEQSQAVIDGKITREQAVKAIQQRLEERIANGESYSGSGGEAEAATDEIGPAQEPGPSLFDVQDVQADIEPDQAETLNSLSLNEPQQEQQVPRETGGFQLFGGTVPKERETPAQPAQGDMIGGATQTQQDLHKKKLETEERLRGEQKDVTEGEGKLFVPEEFDVDRTQQELPAETEQQEAAPQAEQPDSNQAEAYGDEDLDLRRRQDKQASLKQELTEDDIMNMPLSKIWPKSEVDAIEDDATAAFMTALRNSIPAKPRTTYKKRRWAKEVEATRGLANLYEENRAAIDDAMRGSRKLEPLLNQAELMAKLPRKYWADVGPLSLNPDSFKTVNGEKIPVEHSSLTLKKRYRIFETTNLDEIAKQVQGLLEDAPAKSSGIKTEIRVYRSTGKAFINKIGDPERRALKSFDSVEEAREYRNSGDNQAELEAAWEAIKERDNVKKTDVRSGENRPRQGKDHRNGRDIEPKEFAETFGLRKVDFGKWVKQGKGQSDRQGAINEAYDAFMDLAEIIGVPPKAIGFGGNLVITFGKRGHGSAAAHFEPGLQVINLTKTKGAGSLAHEWFHGLDNFFQRKRGEPDTKGRESLFVTYNPEDYYLLKGRTNTKVPAREFEAAMAGERLSNGARIWKEARDPSLWEKVEGVRPEVGAAFAEFVEALNRSPMRGRSGKLDKAADGYWSRIIERAARSFENYVIHKMNEQGRSNDYLANVTAFDEFVRDEGRYPYLKPDEVQPIADALDKLFETIETKQEGDNVVMFQRNLKELDEKSVDASTTEYTDTNTNITYVKRFVPSGKEKWQIMSGVGQSQVPLSDMFAYDSYEEARKATTGRKIAQTIKRKNEIYQSIPNTWSGKERALAKALIDSGVELKYSGSSQSKSKYIILPNGDKVRISDHNLPIGREQPDYDFRYSQSVNEMVSEIVSAGTTPAYQRDQSDARTAEKIIGRHTGENLDGAYEVVDAPDQSLADAISVLFGKEVVAIRPTGSSGIDFNGVVLPGLPNKLFINADSANMVRAATGHELVHATRRTNPALYNRLAKMVEKYATDTGYAKYRQRMNRTTDANAENRLTAGQMREEFVADMVGDVFADPRFVNSLTDGQKTVWRKFVDALLAALDDLIVRVGGKSKYGTIGADQFVDQYKDLKSQLQAILLAEKAGRYGKQKAQPMPAAADVAFSKPRKVGDGEGEVYVQSPDIQRTYAYARSVGLERVGVIKGPAKVRNSDEAASLVRSLAGKPQEHYVVFGTDNDGNVKAVVRVSVGVRNAANVDPKDALGPMYRAGATKMWTAHNHPSDSPIQSPADSVLHKRIIELTEGTGLEVQGALVIAGNEYSMLAKSAKDPMEAENGIINQSDAARYEISERGDMQRLDANGPRVKESTAAIAFAKKHYEGKPTLLLMNNQLQYVGKIELPNEIASEMRSGNPGKGFGQLASAIDESNATAGFVVGEMGMPVKNLANAAKAISLNVVDILTVQGDAFRSTMDASGDLELDGIFYQRKEQPTKNKAGLYSAVEKAVIDIQQNKAQPQQWLAMIRKQPGVKQEELDWMGLEQWLGEQQGTVTKDQVQDFVRANMVQVNEVQLGTPTESAEIAAKRDRFQELSDKNESEDLSESEMEEMDQLMRDLENEPNPWLSRDTETKFSSYQEPGGENYRELLLTLPVDSERALRDADDHGIMYRTAVWRQAYKSSHFDEPNILAHVRYNDRTDADGKRVLFIEEVQSDWHQAGRKKGYANPPPKELPEGSKVISPEKGKEQGLNLNGGWMIELPKGAVIGRTLFYGESEKAATQRALDAIGNNAERTVPDAPFKQSWPMLAMKRMIRYASENGFDRIAWTPGDVQADRYDLSKQVRSVEWDWLDRRADRKIVRINPSSGNVLEFGVDKNGVVGGLSGEMPSGHEFDGKNITDVIGKEIGEQILNEEYGSLSGEGLRVGGEGMRAFYDRILKNEMGKYVKKFGARVGTTTIGGKRAGYRVVAPDRNLESEFFTEEAANEFAQAYERENGVRPKVERTTKGGQQVWSVDVTPKMREAAMDGQPMFQRKTKQPGLADTGFSNWTMPGRKWDDVTLADSETLLNKVKSRTKTSVRDARIIFQDKLLPIKEAVEQARKTGTVTEFSEVYMRAENAIGKIGDKLDRLQENHIEPLVDAMRQTGIGQDELGLYLYAKHAKERNKLIADRNDAHRDTEKYPGSGMADSRADEILGQYKGEKLQQIEKLANMVYGITGTTKKTLLDSGLVRPEHFNADFQNYIPLKGTDSQDMMFQGTGSGFDTKAKDVHAALGRMTPAKDILPQILADAQRAMIRAGKNDVGQSLLRLALDNPNESLWSVNKVEVQRELDPATGKVVEKLARKWSGDNIFITKVKGKSYAIELDPQLAKAMKNLGSENMNIGVRGLAKVNRWLSYANTALNPEFTYTNFWRDLEASLVQLEGEHGRNISASVLRDVMSGGPVLGAYSELDGKTTGMARVIKSVGNREKVERWEKWFERYRASGGKISYFRQESIPEQRKRIEKLLKQAERNPRAYAGLAARETVKLVENINGAVENAVRVSTYKAAIENGYTETKAAHMARDLTVNFNRRGEAGVLINSAYLFYNASIQGTYRYMSALKHPKVRSIMYKAMAGQAALTVYNYMVAGDDDDGENRYEKIPDYEKARNIIIMLPGNRNPLKIPLPYGYNALMAIPENLVGMGFGRRPGKATANIGSAFWNAFNPLAEGTWLTTAAPTIFDPFIEIVENRNFFGQKIAPEDLPFDDFEQPNSDRYFESVNPQFKWLSKNLNSITGGSDTTAGLVDISPEWTEHLWDTYAGAAGAFLQRSLSFASDPKEAFKDNKAPLVRKFYGANTRFYVSDQYDHAGKEIAAVEERMKRLRANGERDRYMEVQKDNKQILKLASRYKSTEKRIAKLRKTIKDTQKSRTLNKSEKDDRVKEIRDRIDAYQIKFNADYNEAFYFTGEG